MIYIIGWLIVYSITVAASIMLLGKPSAVLGNLNLGTLVGLLLDWRFLLGGVLALMARFMFVIINNLASKTPSLANAHLSLTAVATTASIICVVLANQLFLHERLTSIQLGGTAVVLLGLALAFQHT